MIKMNKLRTQLFLLRSQGFMYFLIKKTIIFLIKKTIIVSFPAKDPRITYYSLNQNPTGNNPSLAKST